MDLYRFFHPHHNPRLRRKQLRQQEISELELAAKELLLALKRAALRLNSAEDKEYLDLLDPAIHSTELAGDFLSSLSEQYPEDKKEDFIDMLKERKNAPGWEAWTRLLYERLYIIYKGDISSDCNPLNSNKEDLFIDSNIKIKVNG